MFAPKLKSIQHGLRRRGDSNGRLPWSRVLLCSGISKRGLIDISVPMRPSLLLLLLQRLSTRVTVELKGGYAHTLDRYDSEKDFWRVDIVKRRPAF